MSRKHHIVMSACKQCGKEISAPSPSKAKKGWGIYCSTICSYISRGLKKQRPAEERFFNRIKKTETCWLWTGKRTKFGYGRFRVASSNMLAHRYSWAIHKGPIPDGINVLHNCPGGDNPACVNPSHLWLGTQQDNVDDMMAKGRANKAKGKRHGSSKLTDTDVIYIREKAKNGIGSRVLAIEFGVTQSTIRQVVRGKSWKHLNYLL